MARVLLDKIPLELEPLFFKTIFGRFSPYFRVDILLHPRGDLKVPLEVKISRYALNLAQVKNYALLLSSPMYLLALGSLNSVKVTLYRGIRKTVFTIPFLQYKDIKLLDNDSNSIKELVDSLKL